MRIYSQIDEENCVLQSLLGDWTRSGYLTPAQQTAIEPQVAVNLRRTGFFLRALLLIFTLLIVSAAVALAGVTMRLQSEAAGAFLCAMAAIGCWLGAEWLIGRWRFYRFGVEEGLAISAVVLSAVSGALVAPLLAHHHAVAPWVAALAAGAIGGAQIYRRFGYVYAAVAAIVCAVWIPFELVTGIAPQRLFAGIVAAAIFAALRLRRMELQGEFLEQDFCTLECAAWVLLYVCINLQITNSLFTASSLLFHGFFYWTTYVLAWILPVAGLGFGLREKNRAAIDVNLVLTLATLATNKPYLGLQRQPWDPILLGLLLIGSVGFIRRWLAARSDTARHGYTAARLVSKDRDLMTAMATASAALQMHPSGAGPAPAGREAGGGRSGGGGASGTF